MTRDELEDRAPALNRIRLTDTQLEEVPGLLDVCADERDEWGEPWGVLRGAELTVTRPALARDDILRRADYCQEEGTEPGEARQAAAVARSLRTLAEKIVGE